MILLPTRVQCCVLTEFTLTSDLLSFPITLEFLISTLNKALNILYILSAFQKFSVASREEWAQKEDKQVSLP